MSREYEDRYVAFLDICGFSDVIGRTLPPAPSVTVDDVLSALAIPSEVNLEEVILGRIGDITAAKHSLTAFSDCVAISTAASEQGLMNLLFHARAILFRLLKMGFLVRGGIARGLAFHDQGMIFGPAMLEAYRLEREVAVYPRVVLEPSIVETTLQAPPPVDRVFAYLTRRNDDGLYMVHSLWALRMAADSEVGFVGPWREQVDKIAAFLDEEERRLLLRTDGESALAKVRWFRGYFNWAIDRSWVLVMHQPFPAPRGA